MVDEDVRRLEREAAKGDPAACVRYAGVLERGGRRAEAARLLRTVSDSAAARGALAAYPAWTHAAANAGSSNALDVEPVVRKPRVLWRAKIRGTQGFVGDARRLLASQLGVVCETAKGVVVLDPESGEERWHCDWPERPRRRTAPEDDVSWRPTMEILGETLLVWNRITVWRHELATGESLGDLKVPRARTALLDQGMLVAAEADLVVARSVTAGKRSKKLWQAKVPRGGRTLLAASGGLILVWSENGLHALDRRSGRKRWADEAAGEPLADGSGLVAFEDGQPGLGLVLRGLDGLGGHRVAALIEPLALAEGFVVGRDAHRPGLGSYVGLVVDRASGEVSDLPIRGSAFVPYVVARDVVYGASDPLVTRIGACRANGDLLWEIPWRELRGQRRAEDPASALSIALLDRTIFILFGGGALVALTDL